MHGSLTKDIYYIIKWHHIHTASNTTKLLEQVAAPDYTYILMSTKGCPPQHGTARNNCSPFKFQSTKVRAENTHAPRDFSALLILSFHTICWCLVEQLKCILPRDHSHMTFALGGGGGYTKSKNSKGGYVDFILLISAKCEQGEREEFKLLRMSFMNGP